MRSEFLLALEADAWHVVRTADDGAEVRAVATPRSAGDGEAPWQPISAGAAAQVAAALAELGHKGQAVCLGLPSEMVLAGQVDCGGLPRKRRRQAMLFRLEEQLPIEAEQLTADFLPPAAGRALGLAVRTDDVRRILDLLAAAGIEVASAAPTAMLALWDFLSDGRRRGPDAGEADYLLLAGPDRLDAFATGGGPLARWHTANGDAALLAGGIEADLLSRVDRDRPPRIRVIGPAKPELLQRLAASAEVEHEPAPARAAATAEPAPGALAASAVPAAPAKKHWRLHAAGRSAARLLAGKPAGWVDFRRDGLAAGSVAKRLGAPLRVACAVALTLAVAAAALMLHRAGQYDQIARDHHDRQGKVFRTLYPNTPVPLSVPARLRSQAARLAGVSGAGHQLPTPTGVLDDLRAIIAHLPKSLRLRILEIRIDPGGIFLDGQVQTHPDAQTLARALARGGFAVEAPRTENLPGKDEGVSFTLTAKPAPPDQPAPGRLRLRKETDQP